MGRFAEQFLPQPLQFWATHIGQLFKCFRAFIADFHRSTPGGKGTFIADPIAALVGRPVKRTVAGERQISGNPVEPAQVDWIDALVLASKIISCSESLIGAGENFVTLSSCWRWHRL
jgi:hypothetical protein